MSKLSSIEKNIIHNFVISAVRDGDSFDKIRINFKATQNPNWFEYFETYLADYEKKLENIKKIKTPEGSRIIKKKVSWYDTLNQRLQWDKYKEYLINKKFPETAIEDIDTSTNTIIASCNNPNGKAIPAKGLTVGYVQSGKTANYIGLIAKAADAGFRFIIVLTGTKEKLRKQTQARITEDLLDLSPDYWRVLTGKKDFKTSVEKAESFLGDEKPTICVIKKNSKILDNLINFFTKSPNYTLRNPILIDEKLRENYPTLIIDDEADEASINVSRHDDMSAIYRRITTLINLFPKNTYAGYTATPFANVLIDHNSFQGQNLYPEDFIICLPSPKDYFGAEQVFGRRRTYSEEKQGIEDDIEGKNICRTIRLTDIQKIRPRTSRDVNNFQPKMNASLKYAFLYYILAVAAKISRMGKEEHSSMFVHTTVANVTQFLTFGILEEYRIMITDKFNKDDPLFLARLEKIWKVESEKVKRKENEPEINFLECKKYLPYVLENIELTVVNAKAKKWFEENYPYKQYSPLSYEKEFDSDPGKIYLIVGGNILSRGLTLEGLTVSYFLRTTSMYDTLLQMARWFGFRNKYSDLTRLWTTTGLFNNFYLLAMVEEEIRDDIKMYEDTDLDPLSFKVRIRQLPGLEVTGRLKRKDAEVNNPLTYDRARPEVTRFYHKDKNWLINNIDALKKLLKNNNLNIKNKNNIIFNNVKNNDILYFIEKDFNFCDEEKRLNPDNIIKYLKVLTENNSLDNWNIVISGNKKFDTRLGKLKINDEIELNCVNRAPLIQHDNPIYLKTISNQQDIIIDLKNELDELSDDRLKKIILDFDSVINIENKNKKNKAEMKKSSGLLDEQGNVLPRNQYSSKEYYKIRRLLAPKTGLIVFYPISKNSAPKSLLYKPLNAEEVIISFMIIFPPMDLAVPPLAANYISGVPEKDDEFGDLDIKEDEDDLEDEDQDE